MRYTDRSKQAAQKSDCSHAGRALELYNEELLINLFYHGRPPESFITEIKARAKFYRARNKGEAL